MEIREILQRVHDPHGRRGREHALGSILALIVMSMLRGGKGCAAAFRLRRVLTREQRQRLGFHRETPCHGTLTETPRILDARDMAAVLGAWDDGDGPADPGEAGDENHVAIDGKTLRASASGEDAATHVLAAFCVGLRRVGGATGSAGKGFEIADALALLESLDLKDKVVTGDAVFCQKSICVLAVSKGGEDVFPVTGNQPSLEADIETAFTLPVLPVESHDSGYEKGHGRIERRTIDVLPAEAVGPVAMDWPKLAQVCRVALCRERICGKIEYEPTVTVACLITSLTAEKASPRKLLRYNRRHWEMEIMRRDKDVFLGEDGYANRKDQAPRTSPTRSPSSRRSCAPSRRRRPGPWRISSAIPTDS